MYNAEIDDVISSVKANASVSVSKKLDLLVEVCVSQLNCGSNDFSVAMIGKLFKAQGGLTAQSIRNKTGERYSTIINAFAKYHGTQAIYLDQGTSQKEFPEWIDQITDSNSRWLAKDLFNSNKRLNRMYQVRGEFNKQHALSVDMRTTSNAIEPEIESPLKDYEMEAIESFFSAENLQQFGLSANKHGCLIDDSGRAVTKPGFTDIINKLCGYDAQGNSLSLGNTLKINEKKNG